MHGGFFNTRLSVYSIKGKFKSNLISQIGCLFCADTLEIVFLKKCGNERNQLRFSTEDFSSRLTRKDFRGRRRLEMKKRLGVLHYRRERLERELAGIKAALITLDRQIQRDVAYEQLSICE